MYMLSRLSARGEREDTEFVQEPATRVHVSPGSRTVERPHVLEPDGSEKSSLGSSTQAAAQILAWGLDGINQVDLPFDDQCDRESDHPGSGANVHVSRH